MACTSPSDPASRSRDPVQGGQQQSCSSIFTILWLKYNSIRGENRQEQPWGFEEIDDVNEDQEEDTIVTFGWPFHSVSSGIVSWSSEHLAYFRMVLPGRTTGENGGCSGERSGKRRRLSAEEIEQMSPGDMRVALTAAVNELEAYDEADLETDDPATRIGGGIGGGRGRGGGSDVEGTLQLILEELRKMRTERADERAEVAKIREECKELRAVVAQQQRFMEQPDSRDRDCNLIITGVPEAEAFDGVVNDIGKCRKILEVIGDTSVPLDTTRLGKAEAGRNRPILAKVPSRAARDKILENTKELRAAGPAYRRIYVKKDLHPAIRKEWKRLRDVETAEKGKPVNQGCTIRLDYKKREITRDGVVIDKWSSSFFAVNGLNNWLLDLLTYMGVVTNWNVVKLAAGWWNMILYFCVKLWHVTWLMPRDLPCLPAIILQLLLTEAGLPC